MERFFKIYLYAADACAYAGTEKADESCVCFHKKRSGILASV